MTTPTMTRCLGPGPEHSFRSSDKFNRVCPRCAAKLLTIFHSSLFRRGVRKDPREKS